MSTVTVSVTVYPSLSLHKQGGLREILRTVTNLRHYADNYFDVDVTKRKLSKNTNKTERIKNNEGRKYLEY